MGKWTPDYLDDVLHSRIKHLVSGAIQRASLEKTGSTINYETFVKELDTGDSFTTSLIDILVKELADRRTRTCYTENDRGQISDRTAKSLRTLAAPLQVHRDRPAGRSHHVSRRTVNLADYLTVSPNEMDMEEDEDEFENMLDNPLAAAEGARINTDLYDAYGSHLRANASASPPVEDRLTIPQPSRSPPITNRSGPWSMPPAATTSLASTSSLSRQPSIRRPIRSRTVDFNDFTYRRRSSIRESLGARSDANDGPSEVRENSWNRNSQSTRRFFPFTRTRRHDSAGNLPWIDAESNLSADAVDESYGSDPAISAAAWFSFPAPISPPHDPEVSDDRAQLGGPRLRRGGVRPPESMLSRHASPVLVTPPQEPIPASEENRGHSGGDVAAYPTPGSAENEILS